jgi:hypothetical protein
MSNFADPGMLFVEAQQIDVCNSSTLCLCSICAFDQLDAVKEQCTVFVFLSAKTNLILYELSK